MTQLVQINGVLVEAEVLGGVAYVNLKRICEDIGLAYGRQLEKVKSDERSVVHMMCTTASDGKNYEMWFISVETMVIWLSGINPNKVKEECRKFFEVYRREVGDAIVERILGKSRKNEIAVRQEMLEIKSDVGELQQNMSFALSRIADIQEKQADIQEKQLELSQASSKWQDLCLEYLERIDQRTSARREEFSPEIKRKYVNCISEYYSGRCPCCQCEIIVENGRRKPHLSHVDHYHARSMNQPEHGWIVCKTCNNRLRDRKPHGFWFSSAPAFQQFQRLLHSNRQKFLFTETLQ